MHYTLKIITECLLLAYICVYNNLHNAVATRHHYLIDDDSHRNNAINTFASALILNHLSIYIISMRTCMCPSVSIVLECWCGYYGTDLTQCHICLQV